MQTTASISAGISVQSPLLFLCRPKMAPLHRYLGSLLVLFCCILLSKSLQVGRFPRPNRVDFRALSKKSLCTYCSYDTRYYEQKLDHFNFNQDATFQQRYLVNSASWESGGPIFFYTGNEGDVTWFANNTGFMWDNAKEFGAMLVFGEHRYYGKTLPFGSESYDSPKHLGYLTSEQALADFATLIRHIKKNTPGADDSPVIAIGGSYGGMLSAWMRMKYPNIITGSLAASAPILQFQGITPCEDFYGIVTKDFHRDGGDSCVNSIRKSWDIISSVGKTSDGRNALTKIFKLCSPITSTYNVTQLSDWLSATWVNLAMVDYPYNASFLEPLPAWPIKKTCSYLTNADLPEQELLDAIAKAVGVYYNSSGQAKCFNLSQQAVSSLGDQGWDFQACTEMVMPLCTDGENDMFRPEKWDFDEFAKACQEDHGVTPRQFWIETQYGGRNIKAHSNIIFSNGLLDPWSAGGVTQSLSSSLVAVLIAEGAHHLDLRHSNAADPPSVVQARETEKKYLHSWITEHYANRESRRLSKTDPDDRRAKKRRLNKTPYRLRENLIKFGHKFFQRVTAKSHARPIVL